MSSTRALARTPRVRRLVAAAGILAVLAASACVTRTVENHGLVVPEPAPDTTGVGVILVSEATLSRGLHVVRYLNTGSEAQREARRKQATGMMVAKCGGLYLTSHEGAVVEDGVVKPQREVTSTTAPFWYIQYACLPPTRVTMAPE